MVLDGAEMRMTVPGRRWIVQDSARWCCMVQYGSKWCRMMQMVQDRASQCQIVLHDAGLCQMVQKSEGWYQMMQKITDDIILVFETFISYERLDPKIV